jgi:hypothetical protein
MEFLTKTLWPILSAAIGAILVISGIWGIVLLATTNGQNGKWLIWPAIGLIVLVIVQFVELHRRRTSNDDEVALGLAELDRLDLVRQLVRLCLTRNNGMDNWERGMTRQHWNDWAFKVEEAIRQLPSLDLSFLAPIPDQWRQAEINDETLTVADQQLVALISERDHYRHTAFALSLQVPRPRS